MEDLRAASHYQDRRDVVGLLDCSWFGLEEGSLQIHQHQSSSGPTAINCSSNQAAAGGDLQQDSRRSSRQRRTNPVPNKGSHAPAGLSASGWDESARNSPADQGAAMDAKNSSSSPNTPLSDRLLSHSEASGSSIACPPPAKQPSPNQGGTNPAQVLLQRKAKEVRGTSPGSSASGSLSDASITLCLPGMHDSPPVHGGVPSTKILAAARSGATTSAFRSPLRTHSEEVYPHGVGVAMRRPSALTSAFAAAPAQPLQEPRRRPKSLLSMQLRNSSRESSQTKSPCDSNGRSALRGLPPRVPGRPAFWLSASAGAHPPLLASAEDERPSPRAAAPARWLPRDPPAAAARTARRPMAASAPVPGCVGSFAAQLLAGSPADDSSATSLVRSLSDTVPSSTPCSPAPPPQCTRRSHHQEHRAVHRWLESLPGRAATSSSLGTVGPSAATSALLDRPRARGGAASEPGVTVEIDVGVEDGYCHVVCAGCSPLGRHARHPPATRPRLLHLQRARTCPDPLPQVGSPGKANGASAAALGSWAERIFVHQPHKDL
ncbi:g11374 [Coccomyxa elongata]